MKKVFFIFILIATISGFFDCSNSKRHEKEFYIESYTSFFDLRNKSWIGNDWIRKPENLLMIHETFNAFGYRKLFSGIPLDENFLIIHDIYIKRKPLNLLDSLEFTYNRQDIKEKYYREFWERRKAEKNDSVVFVIIKDINRILKDADNGTKIDTRLVNDTLYSLLKVEFGIDNLTEERAKENFEILRNYGFHQSAYNVLYERYEYTEMKWDKEVLKKSLVKTPNGNDAWLMDNTK